MKGMREERTERRREIRERERGRREEGRKGGREAIQFFSLKFVLNDRT